MFAVVKTGGKQYRVSEGDRLRIETLEADAGASVRKHHMKRMGHRQNYTEVEITGINAG